MSTSTPDYLTTLREGWADAMQQWLDQSTQTWEQWSQAWAAALPGALGSPAGMPGRRHEGLGRHGHRCRQGPYGHGGRHRDAKGCGCGDLGRRRHEHGANQHEHHGRWEDHDHQGHGDSGACCDGCTCCVPDADVIVHARAGEVRVVPFQLSNPWRREREVTLEVGPWHQCQGEGLEVVAALEDQELVLAPCEDRLVRLVVSVRAAAGNHSADRERDESSDERERDESSDERERTPSVDTVGAQLRARRTKDVAGCASAYADVRFEGCGRPQRVAVLVSPADCDPVETCCDCGC